MTCKQGLSWADILSHAVGIIEKGQNAKFTINPVVQDEITRMIQTSIAELGFPSPSVAKLAGIVAFWVCKLQPVRISEDSPNYYCFPNEHAALLIGLTLADLYKDEKTGERKQVRLDTNLMGDWMRIFRYHSYTLHSTILSFEILLRGSTPIDTDASPQAAET